MRYFVFRYACYDSLLCTAEFFLFQEGSHLFFKMAVQWDGTQGV